MSETTLPEPPRRRRSDYPTLETLDLRVTALEDGMENIRLQMTDAAKEIKANTRLTEDIHGKAEEMYEIFDATRNGFRMIQGVGNLGVRVLEFGGKIAKPLVWIVAAGAGIFAYLKTGHFTIPDWTLLK